MYMMVKCLSNTWICKEIVAHLAGRAFWTFHSVQFRPSVTCKIKSVFPNYRETRALHKNSKARKTKKTCPCLTCLGGCVNYLLLYEMETLLNFQYILEVLQTQPEFLCFTKWMQKIPKIHKNILWNYTYTQWLQWVLCKIYMFNLNSQVFGEKL